MSVPKTIPIKTDWDAQPHINEKKGHHVIRKNEQELLVDFISRRSEGSLLVSGKRGVGKSSSVFSSIQQAKEKIKEREILIPVLVIAPHFEINDGHQPIPPNEFENFKKLIFQTLIRRLYKPGSSELKEHKELQSSIEKLYTKAVAKEVIKEIKNTELTSDSSSIVQSSTLNIGHSSIGKLLIFALGGGIFSVLPLYSQLGFVQYLISLGIGVIPTIVYSFQKSITKTTQMSKEYHAQDYYKHDYSISNIQSDLEETLRNLSDSKYKVVFIIDELDKMSPVNVMSVVTSLKSLVTHGYAIFIFVTGTEFFDSLEEGRQNRSPAYTLFTHRVFLQRPLFHEMEQFIDGILDGEQSVVNMTKATREYKDFRNYLCYLSKVDFFDLNHIIRDHIVGYDQEGRPILNYSLNNAQIVLARLQKAMGHIYVRKSYSKPSDWQKNDLLLQRLYWFLEKLTTVNPGIDIAINTGQNLLQITFPNSQPEQITDQIEASAISDLIDQLARLQYLEKLTNLIRVLGNIMEVPTNPNEILSKEERAFVEESRRFQELMVAYYMLMGGNN